MTLFILIVCVIALLFLVINFIFAPHIPYGEKYSIFECGFHSFLGQNRMQFSIMFFLPTLAFIVFDVDLLLLYPLVVSGYTNDIYGLSVALIFIFIVTAGFVFELGKGALKIDSRQNITEKNINSINLTSLGINKNTH